MFDRVPDMAAKRAELSGDATAFVDHATGRHWSFSQVNDAAARMGAGLLAMGLAPGDRVALLAQTRVEVFIALFAAQKSGLVLVLLNWRLTGPELAEQARSVAPSLLLADPETRAAAQALAETLSVPLIPLCPDGPGKPALMAAPDPLPPGPVPADRTWYLLFTSGTTGRPRAVIQTARMAWANAVNLAQAIDLTRADSTVAYLPMFHTAGVNLYALPTFLFGGRVTVLRRFEPDALLDLVAAGALTRFFGVPAIYRELSLMPRAAKLDWSVLRCGCGGAALPEPLIRHFADWGTAICNGFGMTETGPTTFLMDPASALTRIGSVGKVQTMTEVRLAGVPDEAAGTGEILLRGPAVSPGYFGETPGAALDPEGWLPTGDVARRDADGYYYVVDRLKDMFVSGGENVWPAEVERVLHEHPAILEAAVVGRPDPRWGEVGAAFVVPRPGHCIETESLPHWCRARLAGYKVPKSFHLVEDFPRTAAGKVRKPALKDWLE